MAQPAPALPQFVSTVPTRHGMPAAAFRFTSLVLTEPTRPFRVTESMFASKAKRSPYVGMELVGQPVLTLVRGRVVVDRREP